MDPAVDIDDLVVRRGGTTILHGISVQIPRGSITSLVGPSGSGKTTLLRTLVGVQQIAAGRVTVLGDPAGARALRSRIGYVTQAASVYTDLSVTENIGYFAGLYGSAPLDAVDRVLPLVGLEKQAHQVAGSLSGGQLSRCSLACALVGDPDLLVLDEPTVGQDPVLREELWSRFRALAEAGVTLLVSSHIMDEADRGDRLVLLREGAVLADSTPTGLRRQTGTSDLEQAFLSLVRAQAVA